MNHDKYDIDRIAELARIKLSEAERGQYKSELTEILAYVEKLQTIPTDTVPPAGHAAGSENVTRADNIRPSSPKSIISSAPDGNYSIPSVRSLWTS